ncbi:MAG TPA: hypothetical protein VGE07_29785 [Herpetosiphonaceae bacterium]
MSNSPSLIVPRDARTQSLVAGIAQLGPLSLAEIQRLWWPHHAERTVQRALRRLTQAGILAADVPYQRVDGRTHRLPGTRYHLPGQAREPPTGILADTRRVLLDALHAVRDVPGLLGLQTPTLRPDGRGQVLVLRRCRRDPPTTAAGLTWLTDSCPPDASERAYLLIVDDGQQPAALHTRAAACYAQRCAPATWPHGFPPPIPLLLAQTPGGETALVRAWQAGWPGVRLLATTTHRLVDGWLAPGWQSWDGPAPRRRLWLEGWLPDLLTPANNERWDVMDYWRPRT